MSALSVPISAQASSDLEMPSSDYLSTDHASGPFRIAMVVPPYFDVPPKA